MQHSWNETEPNVWGCRRNGCSCTRRKYNGRHWYRIGTGDESIAAPECHGMQISSDAIVVVRSRGDVYKSYLVSMVKGIASPLEHAPDHLIAAQLGLLDTGRVPMARAVLNAKVAELNRDEPSGEPTTKDTV